MLVLIIDRFDWKMSMLGAQAGRTRAKIVREHRECSILPGESWGYERFVRHENMANEV